MKKLKIEKTKSFMGTIVSGRIRFSDQLYVTTILFGHSRMGMIMHGHKRIVSSDNGVWAQMHNRVWVQSSMGTIM